MAFRHLVLALWTVAMVGCSPFTAFFSGDRDNAVLRLPDYRTHNPDCDGLDLSSPHLDVPTFRRFTSCINSNGSMGPLDQLVRELKDDELEPLVEIGNRLFLKDKRLLFEIASSFDEMDRRGILDPLLENVGNLLGNREFFVSILALFKETLVRNKLERLANVEQPSLLKAFEILAQYLEPARVDAFLETATMIAESPSFESYQAHVQGFLAETFTADRLKKGHWIREIIDLLSRPSFYRWILHRRVLGNTSESLAVGTAKLRSLFGALVQERPGGTWLTHLSRLFAALNEPLHCFGNGLTVQGPLEPILLAMGSDQRLNRDFFLRNAVLDLVAVGSICDLPRNVLRESYPAFRDFAQTGEFAWLVEIVEAMRETDPKLVDAFVEIVQHGTLFESSLREGLRTGIFEDLVLVATVPGPQASEALRSTFAFLKEPQREAGGLSFQELVVEPVLTTDPRRIDILVRSTIAFLSPTVVRWGETLSLTRKAFVVGGVHPWLQVGRELFSNATREESLYRAIIVLAELPSFPASLQQLSAMAKDGRLKRWMREVLRLFKNRVEDGRVSFVANAEPRALPKPFHRLASQQIPRYVFASDPADPNDPCLRVSLDFDFWNPHQTGWAEQYAWFSQCVEKTGDYPGITSWFDRMACSDVRENVSFFSALHTTALALHPVETRADDVSFWVGAVFDPDFAEAIPKLLEETGGLLKTLGATLSVVTNPTPILDRLARLLSSDRIVEWVAAWARAGHEASISPEKYAPSDHFRPEIELAWEEKLKKGECVSFSGTMNKRREEIRARYFQPSLDAAKAADAISRLLRYGGEQALKRLVAGDFIGRLEDVLQPAPVEERWLLLWDSQKRKLSVEVADPLRELEALLINSDIEPEWKLRLFYNTNFALYFLGVIAESWGDVPASKRPPGATARTLRDAVTEIENSLVRSEQWIGYPELPRCVDWNITYALGRADLAFDEDLKGRIFNIRQAVGVLKRLLPKTAGDQSAGLVLLRDFLFLLHPRKTGSWEAYRAVIDLSRSGFVRSVALAARETQRNRISLDVITELLGEVIGRSNDTDRWFALFRADRNPGLSKPWLDAWMRSPDFRLALALSAGKMLDLPEAERRSLMHEFLQFVEQTRGRVEFHQALAAWFETWSHLMPYLDETIPEAFWNDLFARLLDASHVSGGWESVATAFSPEVLRQLVPDALPWDLLAQFTANPQGVGARLVTWFSNGLNRTGVGTDVTPRDWLIWVSKNPDALEETVRNLQAWTKNRDFLELLERARAVGDKSS